jgi:hypothetical protein
VQAAGDGRLQGGAAGLGSAVGGPAHVAVGTDQQNGGAQVVVRGAADEVELARVVRGRPSGTDSLPAVREHYRDGLRERDPITGLNDHPQVRSVHRMITGAPSPVARMERFRSGAQRALAEALHETAAVPELSARPTAAQIVAVRWTLAHDNADRPAAGEPADGRYAGAVADAEHAFALLENGLRQPAG